MSAVVTKETTHKKGGKDMCHNQFSITFLISAQTAKGETSLIASQTSQL